MIHTKWTDFLRDAWGGDELVLAEPPAWLNQDVTTIEGVRKQIADLTFPVGLVYYASIESDGTLRIAKMPVNKSDADLP